MSLSSKFRAARRSKLNKANRERLKNSDFSIISSNCVAGVILHELEQRFNSPTVNLWFCAEDFVRFCADLENYLSAELEDITTEKDECPIGRLDDITLNFTHYSTFEEAKQKWNERKERINFENIYFIMTDRDGCTDEIAKAFDELSYKHKVLLSSKPFPKVSCNTVIENINENDHLPDMCRYESKFSGKRLIDRFDYVAFLNER